MDFNLDTSHMNWHPSGNAMIGTELKEGGETFEQNPGFAAVQRVGSPENEIMRHIIIHDNMDYRCQCRPDLSADRLGQAALSYLSFRGRDYRSYVSASVHNYRCYLCSNDGAFLHDEIKYRATEMLPFSCIETGFCGKIRSDEIYGIRATIPTGEVRSKVFKGFTKACHTLYKFDSDTERRFAIVLENDNEVLKWMRLSPRQFNIYYGPGGISRYDPDFIVKTEQGIFMVQTKASNEMNSQPVLEKDHAALVYCRAVSDWNKDHDGKPWDYSIISHDDVRLNLSFSYLVSSRSDNQQI